MSDARRITFIKASIFFFESTLRLFFLLKEVSLLMQDETLLLSVCFRVRGSFYFDVWVDGLIPKSWDFSFYLFFLSMD